MTWDDRFIEKLKARLAMPLPGEEVQFLMAPVGRERIKQIHPENYSPRLSAVLILIFPVGDSYHIVLTERPKYDGVHSGQVAFPGGKMEITDKDLEQTAIREAQEEVGVDPGDLEILGKLTELYITPSNFLVSPFVAFCKSQPDFIPHEREVERIITVDLFSLGDEKIRAVKTIEYSNGSKIKTPYFSVEGLTVWGATAMILSELNIVVREAISS